MDKMSMKHNRADPCCFFKWKDGQLCVMLLWVDNFDIMGPREMVIRTKEELKGLFEMKNIGQMVEYVGYKISWN